jgi:hypothetical protein
VPCAGIADAGALAEARAKTAAPAMANRSFFIVMTFVSFDDSSVATTNERGMNG